MYRTRDRVIPFGLFWIYLSAIPSHLALDRLSQTRAINTALAMAFKKPEEPQPQSLRDDRRDAYVAE